MYVTAQTLLRRRAILRIVEFRAKIIALNVSVCNDQGPFASNWIDGFLNQIKR